MQAFQPALRNRGAGWKACTTIKTAGWKACTTMKLGLTTNAASFIEQARSHGDVFIAQPYELYSPDNQDTWRRLYARIRPRWERYANDKFLQGVRNLALDPNA